MQLQRAARGSLGRGDALARIAEVGWARADELASNLSRILGVKERSFRRKLKKPPAHEGIGDTRGGGTEKKGASERPSRRAREGSTKAAPLKKPASSASAATG